MKDTFRQAWLMGKGGPWEIKELPIPKPGYGQLLVKMQASSICNQTDLNTIKARHPPHDHQVTLMYPHHFRIWDKRIPDKLSHAYPRRPYVHEPYPSTMGHEGMGVVVEVGPYTAHEQSMMASSDYFKVGDRVSIVATVGGFGEYVISDAAALIKVPDSLGDEEASLYEPVLVVYNVLKQIIALGDRVLILGQGALGLIATQMAKAMGASQIIVSEPIAFKRELAKKFGANIALDPGRTHIVHEIERITDGKGMPVVIEAAGKPETIEIIPYVTALGAKVGQIGACCDPVLTDWSYIHFKGMKVVSSGHEYHVNGALPNQWKTCMQIMATYLDMKPLITHRYRLDDIDQAFRDVETGNVIKGVFLFD